jgi:GNAT superfamily N-acetyltransferase
MPPAFTIRRASAEDAEEMTRLRLDMQTELLEHHRGFDPAGAAEVNVRYFRERIPAGSFVAYVAEEDGRIIGTSGMVLYEAPPTPGNPTGIEGYIMNMYTLPERRGRGVGGALLDKLIAHARSLGARRVWLRSSDPGRPVYQGRGFEEYPRYMHLRLDQGE